MISSEVDPFARTGGLGDVAGGLSNALADLGAEVLVVTPRYSVSRVPNGAALWDGTVPARIGWAPGEVREMGVLEVRDPARRASGGAMRVCLLEDPGLFGRDGIYGDAHGTFGDNELRFVAMSRAALAVSERAWGLPDVVHTHDWHAAPAVLSARMTMGERWRQVPTVFTIHNLAFQGVLGFDAMDRLQFPRGAFYDGTMAHEGNVNFMKGAILLSDRVTTVSPTYAEEILRPSDGFGLDALLRDQRHKLQGIVNGIDVARFDPRTDGVLPAGYDASNALSSRRACKAALLAEVGMDPGDRGPLFATVSRLTAQKGIDLLLEIMPALVQAGARLLLVGQGDGWLEDGLRGAEQRFPGRVASRIAFDPVLARRIYAGADFFVVPSRYEPCGLTQMYAMRYGSIPIVTSVGGLRDTVTPVDLAHDTGTGLVAPTAAVHDLFVACEDALGLYRDEAAFQGVMERAMARDSSWRASAEQYMTLYRRLERS